jgi:hypothetical protein
VRIAREREHFVGRHAEFREPCGTAQSPVEAEAAKHDAPRNSSLADPTRPPGPLP